MLASPRSTPRPAPHTNSKKLRETTTHPHRRTTAAAVLVLLLSAIPALAAPGRSEGFGETMHSAFAGLWERIATVPAVFVGLWEEIGTGIDPGGTPAPPPQAITPAGDPATV